MNFKNPFFNGFFLLAIWSFALALLTQRLGRSITLNIIQHQVEYSLPTDTIQSAGQPQDFSVSAYFSLVMLVLSLLPYRLILLKIAQSIFILTQGILVAIDIHLLQTWNSRFNLMALNMLQFPEATLQSLSNGQIWSAVLLLLALGVLAFFAAKALSKLFNPPDVQWKFSPWPILLLLPLALAARGGWQKIPLNTADAH
ncbi:MAG: hypothetical protein ACKOI1_05720, partial [Bacteroidota bacterium]